MTEDTRIKPICALKFDNIDASMGMFKEIIESLNFQNNEITKLSIEIVKANEQQKYHLESMTKIEKELGGVKQELKQIQERPSNNLNTLKIAALTSAISTLIGLTIGKIF